MIPYHCAAPSTLANPVEGGSGDGVSQLQFFALKAVPVFHPFALADGFRFLYYSLFLVVFTFFVLFTLRQAFGSGVRLIGVLVLFLTPALP